VPSSSHRAVYRCEEDDNGLFFAPVSNSSPVLDFIPGAPLAENLCSVTVRLGSLYRLFLDSARGTLFINESAGEGINWLCVSCVCCELVPERYSLPLYYSLQHTRPGWVDTIMTLHDISQDHVDGSGGTSCRLRLSGKPVVCELLLRAEIRALSQFGDSPTTLLLREQQKQVTLLFDARDNAEEPAAVQTADKQGWVLASKHYYRFVKQAETPPLPSSPPVFTASVWRQRLDEAMQHVDKTAVAPLFDRIMKQCEQEVTVQWLIRQACADAGTLESSRAWYYRQEKADWTDEIQERLEHYGKERGLHLSRVNGKLFVDLPKQEEAEVLLPPMTWTEVAWRRRLRARDIRVIINGVPDVPFTPAEEKLFRQRLHQEARVVINDLSGAVPAPKKDGEEQKMEEKKQVSSVSTLSSGVITLRRQWMAARDGVIYRGSPDAAEPPASVSVSKKEEKEEAPLTAEEMRQLRSRDNGPILIGLPDPAEQTTMTCEGSKLQPLLQTGDRIILTPQLPVVTINNAAIEAMPLWQFQRRALAMHCVDSLRYKERGQQVYREMLQKMNEEFNAKESRYFQEAPGSPLSHGSLKDLPSSRLLVFTHVWDTKLDVLAVRKQVVGLAHCDGFDIVCEPQLETSTFMRICFPNV